MVFGVIRWDADVESSLAGCERSSPPQADKPRLVRKRASAALASRAGRTSPSALPRRPLLHSPSLLGPTGAPTELRAATYYGRSYPIFKRSALA
jgi:hypothetical protein